MLGQFVNLNTNNKGDKLRDLIRQCELCTTNTYLKHKQYDTYREFLKEMFWNQYDYWMISQRVMKTVKYSGVLGEGPPSDHDPFRITLPISKKLARKEKVKWEPKVNWQLPNNKERKYGFNKTFKEKLENHDNTSLTKLNDLII